MNKAIYTVLLLLFISSESNAQQVIWTENFEYHYSRSLSAPWTVQGNASASPWVCDIDYFIGTICFPTTDNTTRVAGVRSQYACFPQHSDSDMLLMTPVINLSGYTAAAFKYSSYFTGHVTNGIAERATVEVSTDSGNSWTVLRNAPVSIANHYETQYINLNPYAGNNIRLGFRYSDNGQDSMTGWMIDNLVAFVPTGHDLEFISAGPTDTLLGYALVGDSIAVRGRVMNKGSQSITSYTISYQLDNGSVHKDSISGINLAPFDTASFQLSRQAAMATNGRHVLRMWAHVAGDVNAVNDSAKAAFYGAAFIPNKVTLLEAGTGTWYPFAPQQYVILNSIRNSDYPLVVVAVHDDDPMEEDVAYRDYILHLRGNNMPFFVFDRHDNIIANRYVIVTNPPPIPNHIFSVFNPTDLGKQLEINHNHFGFANLAVQPNISGGNTLEVKVIVTPAVNLSGDYRLALVLTEDSMHGTGSGWEQQNYYSGGLYGAMGGYETMSNPVAATSIVYNDVPHSATPAADGTGALLPSNMTANTQYNRSLYAPLDSRWRLSHLHAIVMLLKGSDNTVLNAASAPIFPLGITPNVNNNGFWAAIYPNPATTSADLLLELQRDETIGISVADVTGKVVLLSQASIKSGRQIIPIRTDNWAAGMYLITVRLHDAEKTLKLTVMPQ